MTDVLPLTTDPESGLQYRLRPATGRPLPACCCCMASAATKPTC